MQITGTFQNHGRTGIQLLVLAAVAAVGVALGRWIVPEGGSSDNVLSPTVAEQSVPSVDDFTIETYPRYTP